MSQPDRISPLWSAVRRIEATAMDEAARLTAVIGGIYDASLDPSLWSEVLGEARDFVGARRQESSSRMPRPTTARSATTTAASSRNSRSSISSAT